MTAKDRIENFEEGNSHSIAGKVYVTVEDDKDFYILMAEWKSSQKWEAIVHRETD